MKCKTGVVLFADTQETTGNRRERFNNKLYFVGRNQKYAIGCAGDSSDIDKFMTYIRSRLQNDDVEELYSYDDLYTKLCEIIESFCVDLRTTYAKIYNDSKMTRFDFQGLFVAPLKTEKSTWSFERYEIYQLDIQFTDTKRPTDRDFYVRRRIHRACIGDGGELARAILDLLEDLINTSEHPFEEEPKYYTFSKNLCAMLCDVVLYMVTKFSITSNTPVHAMYVTSNGAKLLWRNEYWKNKKGPTRKDLLFDTLKQLVTEIRIPESRLMKFVDQLYNISKHIT